MVELSTPIKYWKLFGIIDCNRRVAGSIPVRFIYNFWILLFLNVSYTTCYYHEKAIKYCHPLINFTGAAFLPTEYFLHLSFLPLQVLVLPGKLRNIIQCQFCLRSILFPPIDVLPAFRI